MRVFFIWVILGVLSELTACTQQPPAVSLDHAINSIQHDLVKTHAVPIANYQTWTPAQKKVFEYDVVQEQCRQWTADPIIPIMSGNTTMGLTGTFSREGSLTIGSVTTAPSIGLSGSTTHTVGQSISVPVSYVALSSIPSVEQQMEVERAGALLSQNDGNRGSVAQRIISERGDYMNYVTTLISRFSPVLCGNTPSEPVTFVGARFKR